MIVIYTQEGTSIRDDADDAKSLLLSIYGEKLGEEAYCTIRKAAVGTAYRKFGGPLIQVVSREAAKEIRQKETAIGMMCK